MKKTLLLVIVLGLLLSCRTIMPDKTAAWLDGKQQAVAGVDITGKWDCGPYMDGGWGEGIFTQNGNRVTGTLGPYSVNGIVDGKVVYLVIESGTKMYTAKLKAQEDGRLVGSSVYNAFIDGENAKDADSYNITMKRMEK